MNIAVSFSILASFLWAVTNHIDKYLISGIDKSKNNIKVLLVFSTLIAGIILLPLWILLSHFNIAISFVSLISVLTSSIVYVIATTVYYKALEKNDASIIIIMLQMIPVFSYLLALILFDENLTSNQMLGSIILILSAIIISFDFKKKNNNKKFKALILMNLASLFYAIYFILFDIAIRDSSYYSCAFWYQVGFLLIGLVLICFKTFREPFINTLKKNGKKYFCLNTLNEGLNLLANLLVNFANVLIPIALVNVLNGLQGVFIFIIGLIGTLVVPNFIKEDLSTSVVIQKILCIILGIIGLVVLMYN